VNTATPKDRQQRALRALYGASVFLVAVLFLDSPGTSDVELYFLKWMDSIARAGLVAGYQLHHSVQPPFFAVIFWVVAKSAEWFGMTAFIAYKASLLLAWLLTGLCLLQWTTNGLLISTILLLLIPSSMALGYFDIYLAPLLLLALWGARTKRWALFSASFTLFALTKAQALVLAPFAVLFFAKCALDPRERRDAVRFIASAAAPVALIGIVVLAVFGTAPIAAFQNATRHDMFSPQGLNLSWVITHYLRAFQPRLHGGLLPDGTSFLLEGPGTHVLRWWTRGIFYAGYCVVLVSYARRGRSFEDFVLYSLLGFLAYFILNTGVHENHLFVAAILSIVLFLIDGGYAYHAAFWSLAANVNLILFYGLTGAGLPFSRVVGVDLALVFAVLNVAFFLVMLAPAVGWKKGRDAGFATVAPRPRRGGTRSEDRSAGSRLRL
jgi:hypothetical protein